MESQNAIYKLNESGNESKRNCRFNQKTKDENI